MTRHQEQPGVVPTKIIDGIREALAAGMEPQELANRLGALIDAISEDLRQSGDWDRPQQPR